MSTPVQNSYSENMPKGLPGLIVGSDYNTVTGLCETAAGIGFGLAVSQGANSDKGAVIGGTRLGFRGISVRDVTLENAQLDKYAQYQNMGILTRGQCWAAPAAAVAVNDPVHFNAATGQLSNTGGQGPINGARWVTAGGGDGSLCVVELSGYQRSA